MLGGGVGLPRNSRDASHCPLTSPAFPNIPLCSMRPQLVLMLSALLPVEARLSYLGLRHPAYAAPGEGGC